MNRREATELWMRIESRLNDGLPYWQHRIEELNQVSAVRERIAGRRWNDNEIFRALVLSLLSNSTDWSKVERVIRDPDFTTLFQGFDIRVYAAATSDDVKQKVVWFKSRRAGSVQQPKDFNNLIKAAEKLLQLVQKHGSLENYFNEQMENYINSVPAVAVALGGKTSTSKLPSLGIPLAAEFLKNIGYDVAKPDRHINRATGSFGWISFRKWPERHERHQPDAKEDEMREVMQVMADFAEHLGLPVTYVDNAIWLLCAKSGLSLSNEDLASLI